MSMNEVVERFEAAKSDFATVEGFNAFFDAALEANNAVVARHGERYIEHMLDQVDMTSGAVAQDYIDAFAGVVEAVTPKAPVKTGSSTLFYNGANKTDTGPEMGLDA